MTEKPSDQFIQIMSKKPGIFPNAQRLNASNHQIKS